LAPPEKGGVSMLKKTFSLIISIAILTGCSSSANEFNQNELVKAIYYQEYNQIKEELITNPDCILQMDSFNGTALHYAAAYGTGEIADYLLNHGAAQFIHQKGGVRNLMPIQEAVLSDNVEVYRLLSNYEDDKAHLSILDEEGRSLLHLAASSQAIEMIKLLLAEGIDPNIQDDAGNIPLVLFLQSLDQYESKISRADRNEIYEVFDIFIDYGMDPDISNDGTESVRTMVHDAVPHFFMDYDPAVHTVLDAVADYLKRHID
jgi:ankyrin repeat protein